MKRMALCVWLGLMLLVSASVPPARGEHLQKEIEAVEQRIQQVRRSLHDATATMVGGDRANLKTYQEGMAELPKLLSELAALTQREIREHSGR